MRGYKKQYKRVVSTDSIELTEEQERVLYYLTEEFLTISQIANITKTSPQNISKLKRKLIKKGVLSEVVTNNYRKGVYTPNLPNSNNIYRYHNIGIRIRILHQTEAFIRYKKHKENRKPIIDNNSVEIVNDLLIIYFNKDFFADNVSDTIFNYLNYLNNFIYQLEQHFKIILIKKNIINYEQFRGEIAKVNDPIARKCHLNKQNLKIYHQDGKPRLITDYSYKWNELETVHAVSHREDMYRIELFQKDLLEMKEYKGISELYNLIESQSQTIDKLIEQQKQQYEMNNQTMLMLRALVQRLEK